MTQQNWKASQMYHWMPLFHGNSVQALVTPSDTLNPISFEDIQDHLSVQHMCVFIATKTFPRQPSFLNGSSPSAISQLPPPLNPHRSIPNTFRAQHPRPEPTITSREVLYKPIHSKYSSTQTQNWGLTTKDSSEFGMESLSFFITFLDPMM
jgi:hypothetical protein